MKIKSSINLLLSAFLTFTIINSGSASAKTENLNFSMSKKRLISLELVRAKSPELPTFLFLPGVNRGLLAEEAALQALIQKGFGVVTMNFSTHPFSVSQLDASVEPEFLSKSYTLEDLGAEVTGLSNELKANFDVKTVIPVSISYSSAVSASLPNFPLVIDAAPMTSSAAVNPQLEAYRATLKAAEIFNPIYGPGITRSLLDQAYYTKWTSQVDSMVETYGLNADRKSDMIKGYTVLSRAAEGFVWDTKKTKASTKRVFILGSEDSSSLLKDQLNVILKALNENADMLAFIIKDAGHVVPNDQPVAYANVLTYMATVDTKGVTGIFEIQPKVNKPKLYSGPEAKKYIKDLLNSL